MDEWVGLCLRAFIARDHLQMQSYTDIHVSDLQHGRERGGGHGRHAGVRDGGRVAEEEGGEEGEEGVALCGGWWCKGRWSRGWDYGGGRPVVHAGGYVCGKIERSIFPHAPNASEASRGSSLGRMSTPHTATCFDFR